MRVSSLAEGSNGQAQQDAFMTTSPVPGSDLRGAARLAFDAVLGVIGVVETMHGTILRHTSLLPSPKGERTGGITGLVYSAVRGCTHLAGASVDAAIVLLDPVLPSEHPAAGSEAARAALNGVLGDHLVRTANPLAIPMRLRSGGLPLQLQKDSLRDLAPLTGRLVVLVHGLCLNDRHWNYGGHDHGAALARDLGYTPLYLYYNAGLHISSNGRTFAHLLQALAAEWPVPVEELVIIGHSMGGLVARSACHYGAAQGQDWLRHLRALIFLGTPHHGAPMERGGQWLDLLLKRNPYTAPFTKLGRIRSVGITDLRYGNLLDSDWEDLNRFEHIGDTRQPVPLPKSVECFTMAAVTGSQAGALRDRLLGDGLVPLQSALGEHEEPDRALSIPESRQWVGRGMNHFDLLGRQEVYEQIRLWLGRRV
ncbi:MAG: esterase/lipase family protein [Rhodomicrobium sp.]